MVTGQTSTLHCPLASSLRSDTGSLFTSPHGYSEAAEVPSPPEPGCPPTREMQVPFLREHHPWHGIETIFNTLLVFNLYSTQIGNCDKSEFHLHIRLRIVSLY